MPAPATTGQLRDKVSDMEVGDYIKASLYSDNTAALAVINLNPSSGISEIPLTGNPASTTGFFYFIKVDKGLLIADRVCRHSVSWDAINAAKYIQGIPWANSIIPIMTSNDSPVGKANASSTVSGAWRCFDGSATNSWISASVPTSTSPEWVAFEFTEPKVIKRYDIIAYSSADPGRSKFWTFEASNDGMTWDVLDAYTSGAAWTDKIEIVINNNTPYLKYRISMTERMGVSAYVRIGDIKMYDAVGIIRSLSGGVAFADANGNRSTTDTGNGGWPVNNEWDKYVVNFPTNMIQVEKSLDDVFHYINVVTWCQDTPSLSMPSAVNTARVGRGQSKIDGFGFNPSTLTSATLGCFRPVFEYKE
ncbi:discoidin domain-containing protein [Brevibacillus reuszeri]|uniref:discoidin domain-containing protein n=1 Tax=Brevibacillus reuszeri TaxID=54915 RepID=UPI00289C78F3|nr:discoidin domain-containing protein [Brevibacillus reuszeri]